MPGGSAPDCRDHVASTSGPPGEFRLGTCFAANVSVYGWPRVAGLTDALTIASPGSMKMLNSRSDLSSRSHQLGPPCANVRSRSQSQKRVTPATAGTPEMTPSLVNESPSGSTLLTSSK